MCLLRDAAQTSAHERAVSDLRIRRTDADTQAVWMSGDARALFFWVLQRRNIHGEAELYKVAGRWEAPRG